MRVFLLHRTMIVVVVVVIVVVAVEAVYLSKGVEGERESEGCFVRVELGGSRVVVEFVSLASGRVIYVKHTVLRVCSGER